MKDEEFNDLLQFHAESFELKPSSGSFDSVIRKLNRQKRHKLVVRLLPLAAAIAALPVAWFIFSGSPQAPAVATVQGTEQPAHTESPVAASPGGQAPQDISSPATTTAITHQPGNGSGNPPVKENTTWVAQSPVNTPAEQSAGTEKSTPAPVTRGISADENRAQLMTEQLPVIGIHPENEIIEGQVNPVVASVALKQNNGQRQAIRPESPADKRCLNSRFSVSAFVAPFMGGLFKFGYTVPDQPEQKTAYNIGGQPVSYATGNERALPGMAAGVKGTFILSPGWSISTGITYATLKMNRSVFTMVTEREPGNSIASFSSVETRRRIAEDRYRVSYNYVSVPLQIAYSFKHNKWGIDLTAGTSFNMLQSATEPVLETPASNFNNQAVAQTSVSEYRKITIGVNGGAYVTYNLGNCMDVYAGPQVGSGIQSVYKSQVARQATVPVTVGLETGLKIYF